MTLANPVAAAAIGLALLGEHIQGGVTGLAPALAGTAAAVRGVILLSRAQDRNAAATDPPRATGDRPPSRVVVAGPPVAGARAADSLPLHAEPVRGP